MFILYADETLSHSCQAEPHDTATISTDKAIIPQKVNGGIYTYKAGVRIYIVY